MDPITQFTARVAPLPLDNVDTDQIIPARFLKTTEKAGLAANLFFDWRYLADGSPNPDFVLNQPQYQGVQVLLAGRNFGSGSSREHAPWALTSFGFRAVIAQSFADIFRNNSLKNGLLPVVVDEDTHRKLLDMAEEIPNLAVTVDLVNQQVILPDGSTSSFPIDQFSYTCLTRGLDELGYLLNFVPQAEAFEQATAR